MGRRFVHDDSRRFILSHDNLLIRKTDILYLRPAFTYTNYTGLADDKTTSKISIDAIYQKYKINGDSMTVQMNAQKAFEDGISSADRIYIGGFSF